MPQAEQDRIGAGRQRQLVHERFQREYIRIRTERAQRRHADRHVRQQVVDDFLLRKHVERHGVAVAAA